MASSNVPSPAPLLQRTAVATVDKPVSVILALLPQTVTFGPASTVGASVIVTTRKSESGLHPPCAVEAIVMVTEPLVVSVLDA